MSLNFLKTNFMKEWYLPVYNKYLQYTSVVLGDIVINCLNIEHKDSFRFAAQTQNDLAP